MTESVPSHQEIERQCRVLRLTLDAHGFLKDRYGRLGMAFQVSLLVCSVVFCATTFASDEFYTWLGCAAGSGRYLRAVASIVAFAVSVSLLVIDFKGKAALHGAAVDRWSRTLVEFRHVEPDPGGEWPAEHRKHLSEAYWTADKESVKIPNNQFLALKSMHLRKKEISKLKSKYPNCPRIVISCCLRARDTRAYMQEFWRGGGDEATKRKRKSKASS